MDKDIIKLKENDDLDKLEKLLDGLPIETLRRFLELYILRGSGDPVTFLSALLHGSPVSTQAGLQRRMTIYRHITAILQKEEPSSRITVEVLGLLLIEVDSFSSENLVELAVEMIEFIKNKECMFWKWLELFPKILSNIELKMSVKHGDNEMSGKEFKSHILNSLYSSKWSSKSVVHLAAMFRDISMSADELKQTVEKLLLILNDIDIQEVPPMVYQLLLLSTKGHRQLILEGIITYFNEKDAALAGGADSESISEAEISQDDPDCNYVTFCHIEGTTILHILFAMQQDQELGTEFMKFLKARQHAPHLLLVPFVIAMSLSVMKIHHFQETILKCFKTAVDWNYKEEKKRVNSKWMRDMTLETLNIDQMFLNTIKNSKFCWDHVTQGLVKMGFMFIEAFSPKVSPFGWKSIQSPNTEVDKSSPAVLGTSILLSTFKSHDIVRSEILEHILNSILTKTNANVVYYTDLLAQIVKSTPLLVLDMISKVRQVLDYLALLPFNTSISFLEALRPLFRLSMALKDSLIVVLRKAMFARQLESRKIAVCGFLLFLKYFKVLGALPSSQNSQNSFGSGLSVEVHTKINPDANEALCLEMLNTLRRCFTQQAEVRSLLYEGLNSVLLQNSHLLMPILDLMSRHFEEFYESNEDANPPLKLKPCIVIQGDQVTLQEPLAHLIRFIHVSLQNGINETQPLFDSHDDEDNPQESSFSRLQLQFDKLTERMINAELEDFELDESADYKSGNTVSIKNTMSAQILLGIYEVLMEYAFFRGNYSEKSAKQVLSLYDNFKKLQEILKEKPGKKTNEGNKKTNGGKSTASKLPLSLLSLKFIAQILKSVVMDKTSSHQDCLILLREKMEFLLYIIDMACQKVNQLKETKKLDGEECDKEQLFLNCSILARSLYYYCNMKESSSEIQKPSLQVATSCLNCFSQILTVVSIQFNERMMDFLANLDAEVPSEGRSGAAKMDIGKLYTHVEKFQEPILAALNREQDETVDKADQLSLKNVISLINSISILLKYLPADCKWFTDLLTWSHKIIVDNEIDDNNVVKAILQLTFSMLYQTKGLNTVLRDLARDLHFCLGDIDENITLEESHNFAVVTQKTAPTVLLFMIQHIENILTEIDWVINGMKSGLQSNARKSNFADSLEAQENSICQRLGMLITGIHELVQTSIPLGVCAENLLKMLANYYNCLGMFTKYQISAFVTVTDCINSRFEKLVKLSGSHLTPQVYGIIMYLQGDQSEAGRKRKISCITEKEKVLRETKWIPNLIFSIEQYEKFLIQLSQKSKVNLMENMKLTTSRDFRIDMAAVQAAMDDDSITTDGDQQLTEAASVQEEEDRENQVPNPASKRPKLMKKAKVNKLMKRPTQKE